MSRRDELAKEYSSDFNENGWGEEISREAFLAGYDAGLADATAWRDIADAPRDGTWVVLLFAYSDTDEFPRIARWSLVKDGWADETGRRYTLEEVGSVTHWMPLPEGPKP